MKQRRELIILCSLLFGLSNRGQAQEIKDLRRFRWLPGQVAYPQAVINIDKFLDSNGWQIKNDFTKIQLKTIFSNSIKLHASNEVVLRDYQYIDGVKVQDSWVQMIRNSVGLITYVHGALLEKEKTEGLLNKVTEIRNSEPKLWELLQNNTQLSNAKKVFPARLEIVFDEELNQFEPEWVVDYIDEAETSAWRVYVRKDGSIAKKIEVASKLAEGKAEIFPKGPKFSELSLVVLENMLGDGTTTNPIFSVRSSLGSHAWSANLIYNYDVRDPRFDEVQDYYYLDNAMRWMKDTLNVQLSNPLSISIHVGDKSNNAYYFHNEVRIGSGDGETYQDMPKDPSVVIHETMHAFVDAYAGLDSQGEAGAMNEAFADFFTASILGNPNMAEVSYLKAPFRRTLDNQLKAFTDFTTSIYQNSTIISGTFWDLHKTFGTEKAANIAFRTLVRLGKNAKFTDFTPAITNAASGYLSQEEYQGFLKILADRNWRIVDGMY